MFPPSLPGTSCLSGIRGGVVESRSRVSQVVFSPRRRETEGPRRKENPSCRRKNDTLHTVVDSRVYWTVWSTERQRTIFIMWCLTTRTIVLRLPHDNVWFYTSK